MTSDIVRRNLLSVESNGTVGKWDRRTLGLSFILTMVFYSYKLVGNLLLLYTGCLAAIIMLAVLDFRQSVLLIVALAPNLMLVRAGIGSTAIYGYFLLIVAIKALIENNNLRIDRTTLVLLMMTPIALSIGYAIHRESTLINQFVRYCAFIVIFLAVVFHEQNRESGYCQRLVEFYVIGTGISVALGLIYWMTKNPSVISSGYFRGLHDDRNFFAASLSPVCAISIILLMKGKRLSSIWLACLALSMVGGLLSGSRTFLAVLLLSSLIIPLSFVENRTLGRVFWISLIVILITGLIVASNRESVMKLMDRFTNEDMGGANGRTLAWSFYLDKLFSSYTSVLFGNGTSSKFMISGEIASVEHNSYIQLVSEVGLIAAILIIMTLHHLFRMLYKCRSKWFLYQQIPLACHLISYAMISGAFSDNFHIGLMVCVFAATCLYQNDEDCAHFV